jgi:hypothetical protein
MQKVEASSCRGLSRDSEDDFFIRPQPEPEKKWQGPLLGTCYYGHTLGVHPAYPNGTKADGNKGGSLDTSTVMGSLQGNYGSGAVHPGNAKDPLGDVKVFSNHPNDLPAHLRAKAVRIVANGDWASLGSPSNFLVPWDSPSTKGEPYAWPVEPPYAVYFTTLKDAQEACASLPVHQCRGVQWRPGFPHQMHVDPT